MTESLPQWMDLEKRNCKVEEETDFSCLSNFLAITGKHSAELVAFDLLVKMTRVMKKWVVNMMLRTIGMLIDWIVNRMMVVA